MRPRSAVRRVGDLMDRATGRVAGAAALGAIAYLCAIGLLGVAGWLIARASQQPPVLTLTVAAVSVRAFAIGRSGFRYAERLVGHDGAFRGLGSLRVLLYERLERIGPARAGTLGRGDLLQRMVGDVDAMLDLPLRVVLPWAQAVVVGLVSVVVTWWLLPWAGVAMLVGLVLAATLVPAIAMRVASDSDRRVAAARGRLSAAVLTALQSAVDLRSVAAAQRATTGLAAVDDDLVRVQLRSAAASGAAGGLLVLIQGAVLVVSAVAGVAGVVDGSLDGVLLTVVVLLPLAAFEASLSLPTAALTLRRVQASAERLCEILDAPVEDASARSASAAAGSREHPALPAAGAVIELRDVHVRWPEATSDALHGVNLSVRAGERVAVVGPSGSGKSTLASALVRFLDVRGSYLIDGIDATTASGDTVRAAVGLLAQEAHVFDTTLDQNLRLVRPEVEQPVLDDVIARMRLDTWVSSLPRGLAEPMGEGGVRMSGGQRQRIGLARMLLADFAWVVLDEPTENLDPQTAALLVDDILTTFHDRGLVLITHRMTDALRCDRVVVLDQGVVAFEGTPEEAQSASSWFAESLRLERENEEWSGFTSSMPVGELVLLDRD